MKTITISIGSKSKLDLITQYAQRLGASVSMSATTMDEEMALPGKKVSDEQMEKWLAEEDGPAYSSSSVRKQFATKLAKAKP